MSAPMPKGCNLRSRQGGASLLEVMVASVVLLAGTLGAMAYLGHGQVALLRQGHSRLAAQVAHSRLEELRTVRYNVLETHGEEDTPVQLASLTGWRTTEIVAVDENEDGLIDYKKVRVVVSWPVGDLTQEVELVTLFAPAD